MQRHVWIAGSLLTILTLSVVSMAKARNGEGFWEVRETPMPTQRVDFATSTANGKIYLFAGVWDLGHTVLAYTPPAGGPQGVNPASKLAATWGQVKVGR